MFEWMGEMRLNTTWPWSRLALKQLMDFFFKMDRDRSLSFLRDCGGLFGCLRGAQDLSAMPFSRNLPDMPESP